MIGDHPRDNDREIPKTGPLLFFPCRFFVLRFNVKQQKKKRDTGPLDCALLLGILLCLLAYKIITWEKKTGVKWRRREKLEKPGALGCRDWGCRSFL